MHHAAPPGAARITQKDAVYRIEDPVTGLCVRLKSEPAPPAAAPRIVPQLTAPQFSTWFVTHGQAAEAFAKFIGVQPFEIVRADR